MSRVLPFPLRTDREGTLYTIVLFARAVAVYTLICVLALSIVANHTWIFLGLPLAGLYLAATLELTRALGYGNLGTRWPGMSIADWLGTLLVGPFVPVAYGLALTGAVVFALIVAAILAITFALLVPVACVLFVLYIGVFITALVFVVTIRLAEVRRRPWANWVAPLADWVAPLAAGLVTVAVRLLPAADRARYAEELLAELWQLTPSRWGRLTQLRYGLRQLVNGFALGRTLRSPRRARRITVSSLLAHGTRHRREAGP